MSQFGGSQAKMRWSDVMGSGEGLIIFYILYFIFYILRINTFLHFVDLFIEYQVKSSRVIGRQVHLYYIKFENNIWLGGHKYMIVSF